MVAAIRAAARKVYISARARAMSFIFRRHARSAREREKVRSVVAIRIDRIGDLVVSLPAMRVLKDIFPNARLTALVSESNAPILSGLDWVDETIVYKGFFGAVKALRARKPDLVVDLLMAYMARTALLAYFSGAGITAGFDIEGRGAAFDIAVRRSCENKAMYRHLLDLSRAVAAAFSYGEVIGDAVPAMAVTGSGRKFAEKLLTYHGVLPGASFVAMHPGGYYSSQRWDPDRFIELGRKVSNRYKVKIAVIGSTPEKALVEKVASGIGPEAFAAEGLPLDRMCAVIAAARLLICNNSGPLHVAAALGVPTVSTLGPTDPYLWMPAGDRNIVVSHGPECSPCELAACDSHACMKSITVDEMLAAVAKQMDK